MCKPTLSSLSACGVCFLLCTQLASAQRPGQGQTPAPQPAPSPAPGGDTRTPSPTPSPYPGRQQQPDLGQQQRMPEMERPIFLSGRVTLDDGTPPPDTAVIETVCNGNPRPQAYTDSKGHFSFQLGQNTNVMPDASVGSMGDPMGGGYGGLGAPRGQMSTTGQGGRMGGMSVEQRLMGCELRASLPGFRSEVVNLTGRRFLDNPDLGTIILHRLGGVEGGMVSATNLQAPKDARKAFEKGLDAFKKNKWQDAEKQLQKAVDVYPKYAAAWYRLGLAYQEQNRPEDARKAYAQALAADSRYVEPYRQLAALAVHDKNWKEVADTTDRLVRLDPADFPDAYFFNSIANFNLRNLDAAEKSAREALRLDANHRIPKIEHVLGVILANKQDYAGAAEHMRAYLAQAPHAQDADMVRKQLGEVEKYANAQKPAAPAVPQQ